MNKRELNDMLPAGLADKLVARKDGTFEVKRAYFYRHGMDDEKFAEQVRKVLGDKATVQGRDDFRNWPKTSYFVAVVTPR